MATVIDTTYLKDNLEMFIKSSKVEITHSGKQIILTPQDSDSSKNWINKLHGIYSSHTDVTDDLLASRRSNLTQEEHYVQ